MLSKQFKCIKQIFIPHEQCGIESFKNLLDAFLIKREQTTFAVEPSYFYSHTHTHPHVLCGIFLKKLIPLKLWIVDLMISLVYYFYEKESSASTAQRYLYQTLMNINLSQLFAVIDSHWVSLCNASLFSAFSHDIWLTAMAVHDGMQRRDAEAVKRGRDSASVFFWLGI